MSGMAVLQKLVQEIQENICDTIILIKISLYLASNMPVIVWKESALADYVCKNKLGFAVASLDEIAKQIRTLSSRDYKTMCESARHEGEKLRNGYYTKQALQKAIHLIEE